MVTIFLAKLALSPTKYKYQAAKIPAIFNFYQRCQKSEMTVDCMECFIYPYHICKIAIFGFLSESKNIEFVFLMLVTY